MQYAGYHFLYTFMFSMIVGELIRATKGRTIYILMLPCCNDICSYFLFSEETVESKVNTFLLQSL